MNQGIHKLAAGIAKRERDCWERIGAGWECQIETCHEPGTVLVQNASGRLFPACGAHGDRARERGYTVLNAR